MRVRVEYTIKPDAPKLSPLQLRSLAWELGIQDGEMNRTHWAVKGEDLNAVLRKVGYQDFANDSNGLVSSPVLVISTETISTALDDAETLLEHCSPSSAVDRAHTALHGYLKKVCIDRGILFLSDPSMGSLFKAIRDQCSEFQTSVGHEAEVRKFLGSLAGAMDSLNTIRNRGTLAHPNDVILANEEAKLYINISRSVLLYLDKKLGSNTKLSP